MPIVECFFLFVKLKLKMTTVVVLIQRCFNINIEFCHIKKYSCCQNNMTEKYIYFNIEYLLSFILSLKMLLQLIMCQETVHLNY
jgi:hypothetical protein